MKSTEVQTYIPQFSQYSYIVEVQDRVLNADSDIAFTINSSSRLLQE